MMRRLKNKFSFWGPFFRPRYWGTWGLLLALKGISCCPFSWQKALATLLTPWVMRLAKSRVRVCQVNLQKAFPEWTLQEREKNLRACFKSFVLGAIESNGAYWMSASRFASVFPFKIEGIDHLKAALAQGRGVIICGYHLHLLDVACRVITEQLEREFDVRGAVVYQAHKNPLVDIFLYRWRRRYASKVFRRKELKNILSWLKAGNVLLYAPDQDFGRTPSVFVPFMGVSTATLTAPARMVEHTGSVLVPVWFVRQGNEYVMELLPALENYPSGEDTADAARLNAIYEPIIRKYPEQYLWQHRRFKTRPEGEASFYD